MKCHFRSSYVIITLDRFLCDSGIFLLHFSDHLDVKRNFNLIFHLAVVVFLTKSLVVLLIHNFSMIIAIQTLNRLSDIEQDASVLQRYTF